MPKYLSLTLLIVSNLYASKSALAAIECYPQENARNGLASKSSIVIPPFRANGANRYDIVVSNIGDNPVNVSLRLVDQNGHHFQSNELRFAHHFSTNNNPLVSTKEHNGAQLQSLRTGFIRLGDIEHTGHLTGFLTWYADSCLKAPTLSVTLQHSVWSDSYYNESFVTVNGGNPF